MFSNTIANSDQMSVMSRVLDDYCRVHGILNEEERETVARLVVDLFGRGIVSEMELTEALEQGLSSRAA